MEEPELQTELLDSVQEAVGQGVKLSLRRPVQLEVKGEKLETRVLALASHRAFLLTAQVPSKVERSFSYLEVQGVRSDTPPTQLLLECDGAPCSLHLDSVQQVDEVIAHIGICLQRIRPSVSPLKLNLHPSDRSVSLQALWDKQRSADIGPCGDFSHQYWCVCDFLGLPYREEVQWDVDTIYLTQDSRELSLQDFVHLDTRDLVAIIAALEFNQWFTKLSSRDHKLSTEVCDQIVRVVSRSGHLEELVLDNAGLKSDFALKLAAALSHNSASSLHTLDLSNNSLEDKGVSVLSSQFSKLPKGLKQLHLSRTSLSPKGVSGLCEALCGGPAVASTLRQLHLSGNCLRGDELQNLHNFLSSCNTLQVLDLSCSECSLEQVCASLLGGPLKSLSVLNMSRSVFSHRKLKELPPSFKRFFGTVQNLNSVNLSGTKLPLEALKALLLGLGCNPNLSDVSLDLSCCELRSGGSQVLESCIAEIPNISSLDLSDNGLDLDLTTLLDWLARNRSIRHLSLGKNFSSIKSRNLSSVLEHLVHLIQEEDSPLTSLSLAGSRLKGGACVLLSALGSNGSLTRLDLSGNAMGDLGAKLLAKALQINTKLRTLLWDRNNVSAQGLQDVAAALEKNFTIRFMPIPIVDAAQALKANPEKTEAALLRMERLLLRNHENRKYLQEQAFRLHQGIVTSTTQQVVDSLCVRVQDQVNSLRYRPDAAAQRELAAAQRLMMDARNSKTLLPNLYHLKGAEPPGPCVAAVQDKLESLAGEVGRVLDHQLQTMLESMVDAAQRLCPHVMKRSGLRQELLQAGAQRVQVPPGLVSAALQEQAGTHILNRISEVKLSLASFLSDRIVDQILESLYRSQRSLSDHLIRKDQPLLQHQSPPEAEVLDEMVLQPEVQDPDPRMVTPRSKRKSILVRMLRPVSVASEPEFRLDKALEEVPPHAEDTCPPPTPPTPPTLLTPPTPPTLPTPPTPPPRLQHPTKLRPRARKRTRPSPAVQRATGGGGGGAGAAEQNSTMGKLDEGLDEFFSKRVVSPRRSVKGPPADLSESGLANPGTSQPEESPGAPPSPERQENPPVPRHIGVPVMGFHLLAEMKARQEQMVKKWESSDPPVSDQDSEPSGGLPHAAQLEEAPPTAQLEEAPPTALLEEAPPTALLEEAPPTALLEEAPPTAQLEEAPPTALLGEAPPTALLEEALPTALLEEAPPTAQLEEVEAELQSPEAALADAAPEEETSSGPTA